MYVRLQSGPALCLLLSLAAPLAAQSSLTGFWQLTAPRGDGTFRVTNLQFQQSGDDLSGKLLSRDGIPLFGTVHNGQVHFVATPPPPPAGEEIHPWQRPIAFDGTFADGKLTLQNKTREGPVEMTGKQVDEAATRPPAPLPLPPLHTVSDNGLVRTPPMGWNSWNKFAGRITDADVRGMADAMVTSGMRDAGYIYINIDDTWELGRDPQGNITTNTKFPDMKALADYVHSKGLKIGLYSSPGYQTCARYEGSLGHETQDANSYAAWGFDYLKYDLCGARESYPEDAATLQGLYQKMGDALQATHRPIVYSLCEYGDANVWEGWGTKTGGNLWRTTGDISDNYASMEKIGFSQLKIAKYAAPGHWNDPDMLEVGNGGMTADEYRTHMTLWALLAAPLIAGNDLRTMTDETKSILMNQDVIAIDQDPAYKPVVSLSSDGKLELMARPLHDGTLAVALFNRTPAPMPGSFTRDDLPGKFPATARLTDLWKHQPTAWDGKSYTTTIPAHGVVLLRVKRP